MTPQDLIHRLESLGVTLWVDGERLRFRAPEGVMTPALREQVARLKPQLLELLAAAPAQPRAEHEPFPLTDIQAAYWIGRSVLEGGVSAFSYAEVDATGLDPARLEAAVNALVQRHPMLRAVVDDSGQQRVLPEVPRWTLLQRDLRGREPAALEAALGQLRAQRSHQVRPADTWPLFDLSLTWTPTGAVLHLGFDLLMADVASLMTLLDEAIALYREPDRALPPIGVQFRELVLAEQASRARPAWQRSLAWWRERAATLPPSPTLPLRARPRDGAPLRFARRAFTLEPEGWRRLQDQARERGLTPAAVLAAAYAEVLATWGRRAPMTLNLTLFSRPPVHPDVHRVVGDFTSVLLLEVDPGGEGSFADRTTRLQAQLWRDLEHSAVGGVAVLRELNRGRPRGEELRMPVVFTAVLGLPAAELGLERLLWGVSQTPQVELDHQALELGGRLLTHWDAPEDLYPPGVLDAMFGAYEGLVRALAAGSEAWGQRRFALLPPEQAQARARYNQTAGPVDRRLLWEPLEEQAARRPEALAVVDGALRLSHGALRARAEAVRQALGPLAEGEPVAVIAHKGWEQVAAVLGVLRGGGAYVPLDATWPPERILGIARRAGIRVALTQAALVHALPWPAELRVVAVDTLVPAEPTPAHRVNPDSLAYVIYTSGSTGEPKGVMISHAAAQNTLADLHERLALGPEDRVLALSNLSFDLSVWDIFGVLGAGGALVMPQHGRDPALWLRWLRQERVSLWNTVPALLELLIEHAEQADETLPPSLRVGLLSGDWIPVSLPGRVLARSAAPWRLLSLGGATEAAIWSIQHEITPADAHGVSVPYGRPLRNQTFAVLDEDGEPCPDEVPGELYIGGLGVALGYLHDPARTAERFVRRGPAGERLYRTGDLGRMLPTGEIELLGRLDHQVKIQGHRVELGEIEAALLALPGVRGAVVDALGERAGPRRLVAWVVAGAGGAAPPLAQQLPEALADAQALLQQEAGELLSMQGDLDALERAATAAIVRALGALALFRSPTERWDAAGLCAARGLPPRVRRAVEHWLALLAQDGVLVRGEDGRYCAPAPLQAASADPPRVSALIPHALARYLDRAFAQLLPILRGERDPRELVFGEGTEVIDALYGHNGLAQLGHRLLGALLGEVLRGVERPLVALELGAGSGWTTRTALPALPPGSRYAFTDVSPLLLQHGRALFGEHPGFTTGLLDIQRPMAPQGWVPGSVDLVFATNVLHNAVDLVACLREVRGLLRPGGLLILLEGTRVLRFLSASAQLMEDVEREGDFLLPTRRWVEALGEAGFEQVAAVPAVGGPQEMLGIGLIVGANPGGAGASAALGDRAVLDALRQRLSEYMVPSALVWLDALPLSANGKVDRRRLPRPSEAAAAERVVEPPEGPLERALAAEFARALQVPEVGRRDDFFALGGNSLTAVQLVGALRRALGVELPLRQVFDHPTVAALAVALGARPAAEADPAAEALAPLALEAHPEQAEQPFPLTDVQAAYWLGAMGGLELGGASCIITLELARLARPVAELEGAWNLLIRRHPMLRATIGADGTQRVSAEVPPYRFGLEDHSAADPAQAAAAHQALRARLSQQARDASRWPLFDLVELRLPGGDTRLLIALDVLLFDGWSLALVFTEWATLLTDAQALPPPPGLSFRDYVLAAEAQRGSAAYARDRAWWEARLDQLPAAPGLPLLRDPATLGRPEFTRRGRVVPSEAWTALQRHAVNRRITPSGVLLAAFARVLAAWSAQPRFLLNVTLFNRLPLHPDVGRVVGDFTTLCPLAVEDPGVVGFAAGAMRLQEALLEALDHRLVSGVEVLRWLAAREGGALSARAPVVFTSTLGLPGGAGEGIQAIGELAWSTSQTPQVWLDHQVWETPEGLVLSWDAVDALFAPGMIERMLDAYHGLLLELAADEGAWEGVFPDLLTDAERVEQALANATDAPLPEGLLHEPLFASAARDPGALALVHGARALRYGELAGAAAALGQRLREAGLLPGERVPVVFDKGCEQVLAILGVLCAGGVYQPVDPALPEARLRWLALHGGGRLGLCAPGLEGRLPPELRWCTVEAADLERRAAPPPRLAHPGQAAYVIYTSGSTGTPKGVVIPHLGALNTVLDINQRFGVGPGDRVYGVSSASFDLSVWDLFGTFAAGGTLVLPTASRDPVAWREELRAAGVTVWNSVPALLDLVLAVVAPGGLPALRLFLLSGDWVPLQQAERARAASPGAAVVSLGGATEASIWSIAHPIGALDPEWTSVPYGRALRSQRCVVLDHALRDRVTGVPGELYLGGVGLALEYAGDPEQTAARFITHPRTGERLYRTGDLGRWRPGGLIEFLGRMDAQVKVGGHRVELGEVEAALARCPEVESAVVLARGARGERRLVAWVVPAAAPPAAPPEGVLPGPGLILDPVERLAFKLERRGLRADLEGAGGPLPGTAPEALWGRWAARRSHRAFLDAPVPRETLARLLEALRSLALPERPLPKYRYPSAGDLYPVQTYVSVAPGRVEGLEGGLYYHHPARHTLVRVGELPLSVGLHAAGNQGIAAGAAFALLLVARLSAVQPLYGEHALPFALLEAGHMGQLLAEEAGGLGLGLCPVGGVDPGGARAALGLDDDHHLVYTLLGGAPAVEQAQDPLGERLRQALRAQLPEYMVPSAIVVLERLPLSPNGKVDRAALPEPGAGPVVEAPRGAQEAALAALVSGLLGVEQVPPERNLFELGATSVHLVRLHQAIRAQLGEELPITELFRSPTVRALAARLGGAQAPAPAPAEPPSEAEADDIAIVGLAGRFPDADSPGALWRNLCAGLESVRALRDEELEEPARARRPGYVNAAACLREPLAFDAGFFGLSARQAAWMDPQVRLFLTCCWEALEDAGHPPAEGAPYGVFGGSNLSSYAFRYLGMDVGANPTPEGFQAAVGNDKDYLASQVAYRLGLSGPAVSVQTACSTSLVAVHLACQALKAGECTLALAGGATVRFPHRVGYVPEVTGVWSQDGHCRPFDAQATGTVFGSGVGVVALRRLGDALRDGDRIYAVIRGSAVGNDGSARVGFTAPGLQGQARVVRAALERAGVDPATIGYVEAHGTGTPLGDPIEVAALAEAMGPRAPGSCALGSVKGNLGHLECAAGAAALVKTALALYHRQLPPSLHFQAWNPHIEGRAPFRVVQALEAWPAAGHPRRAGVSSFGIGGTNAHLVLEEAPASAPRPAEPGPQAFVLSARDEVGLQRLARRAWEAIAQPDATLAELAWSAAVGRAALPVRVGFVAEDLEQLRGQLSAWLEGREAPASLDPAAEALRAQVQAWVQGAPAAWLEGQPPQRRVPLPWSALHAQPVLPPPRPGALAPRVQRLPRGGAALALPWDAEALSFVADHRLQGRVVAPGTLWTALAWAGARQVLGEGPLVLVEQRLLRPWSPEGPGELLVEVGPPQDGEVELSVGVQPEGGEPRTLLTARARRALPALLPPTVPPGGAVEHSGAALYTTLAARGVGYGPAFRGVQRAWVHAGRVWATVAAPLGLAPLQGCPWHPAPLDALLHGLIALGGGEEATVPTGARQLWLGEPGAGPWSVALGPVVEEGGALRVDVQAWDAEGRLVAELLGVGFQRVVLERLAQGAAAPLWTQGWAAQALGEPATPARWRLDGVPAPDVEEALRQAGALWTPEAGPAPDGVAWMAEGGEPAAVAQTLLAALQARLAEAPPPLGWVLLTRGAVGPGPERVEGDPSGAALWGLVGAAAAEHPELGLRRVDLDPLTPPEPGAVRRALAAVSAPRLALRRAGALAPALEPLTPPPEALDLPTGPFHLIPRERGSIEGLAAAPRAPRPPGPGEVEVEVLAAGLNFRDVLNVLGRYPGDPGPLGGEVAGRVRALGAGVEDLRVGQPVFGLATDALADGVCAPRVLLAPLPRGVGPEQAAGLPLPWLTAWLCLVDEARLRPGQRVLIHAATGGVGLAAVQVAQRAGAEVWATASPTKWGVLRALGVQRVFSSRDTRFGEAIAALGGVDVALSSLAVEGVEATERALRPGGLLIDIARTDLALAPRARAGRVRYIAWDLADAVARGPERVQAGLAALRAGLEGQEAGSLRLPPVQVFPVEQAPAALRTLARAGHVGKLVLSLEGWRLRAQLASADPYPGTTLITGAFGHLGARLARQLVARGARSLALWGRVGERRPEAAALVAELRAQGAEVRVGTVDVADPDAVAAALAALEGAPPLRRVLHAAGALDDGVLSAQRPERLERVFAAKVRGAWALHQGTLGAELDAFVLFSSVVGTEGGAGQAPYAAANAALDGLARLRRARGLPAVAVAWGPVGGGGMAGSAQATRSAAARGVRLLDPAALLPSLERALGAGLPWVGVLDVDPPQAGPAEDAPSWQAGGSPAEQEARLEALVRGELARCLGLPQGGGLPADRPLADLGLDSLLGIELRGRLAAALGRPLAATLTLDHPTVRRLVRHLLEHVAPAPAAPVPVAPVPAPAVPRGGPSVDELEAMDEAALAALLAEELGEP